MMRARKTAMKRAPSSTSGGSGSADQRPSAVRIRNTAHSFVSTSARIEEELASHVKTLPRLTRSDDALLQFRRHSKPRPSRKLPRSLQRGNQGRQLIRRRGVSCREPSRSSTRCAIDLALAFRERCLRRRTTARGHTPHPTHCFAACCCETHSPLCPRRFHIARFL